MVYFELLRPQGIDFPQFFQASYQFIHGPDPYLGLSLGPFNYPPSAFFFLWWLGFLPYSQAGSIWNISSLAALILSLLLLLKPRSALLAIPLLLLTFFPIKYNLASGQINNFILLSSVLAFWLYGRGKKTLSALFLSFAIAIKLVPVFLLFPFLLARQWAQIRRVAAFTLLFFALSFNSFYYIHIFPQAFATQGKEIYYNQSLLGFLARSHLTQAYYPMFILILAISLLVGRWRSLWANFATFTCVMLLLHQLSWQHLFVFALVPLIFLWSTSPKLPLIISYLLLAANLPHPEAFPVVFRSHQFFGILLLWLTSLKLSPKSVYSTPCHSKKSSRLVTPPSKLQTLKFRTFPHPT